MQVKGDWSRFSKDRTVFGEQFELGLVGAAIDVFDPDREAIADKGSRFAIQCQPDIILGGWFGADLALKDDIAGVVAQGAALFR